jgi:hypothetical protein
MIMERRRRIYRFVCLLCILSILLLSALACVIGGGNPPSDTEVDKAAKIFADSMRSLGKTLDEALKLAQEQAKKWGPKAEYFINRVQYYLQQGN